MNEICGMKVVEEITRLQLTGWVLVIAALLWAVGIGLSFCGLRRDNSGFLVVAMVGLVIFAVFTIAIFFAPHVLPEPLVKSVSQYRVEVNSNADLKALYRDYEVIESDGLTMVLEKKR